MRKLLLSIMPLIAAVPAFAQDLDKRVSLSFPAENAKSALARLSEASGVTFEAGAKLGAEPLLLSVTDVTVRDLMPRISQAMDAEWEKTEAGYRLIRSPGLVRRQENAELEARIAGVKQSLAGFLQKHASRRKWDRAVVEKLIADERKRRQEMARSVSGHDGGDEMVMTTMSSTPSATPAMLALFEVLSSISPRDLASIAPNSRVVFSSQPTPMQKAATFEARKAANVFLDAHNLLARTLSADAVTTRPNLHFMGGLDLEAKPITTPLGKLLLIVSRRGPDSPLTLRLKIADDKGKIVGSADAGLSVALPTKPTSLEMKEADATLSPESLELLSLIGAAQAASRSSSVNVMEINGDRVTFSSEGPRAGRPISAALLDRLSRPEQIDPLSFFVSEALIAAAGARGENLVASPPDDAFLGMAGRLADKAPLTKAFSDLDQIGLDAVAEQSWLVVGAVRPAEARVSRIDRSALGALLRTVRNAGYARLDDLGAFAASLPRSRSRRGIDRSYLGIVTPEVEQGLYGAMESERGMLELYGLLASDQRAMLKGGRTLVASGLTPAQKTQVHHMVYDVISEPSFEGEGSSSMSMAIVSSSGDSPLGMREDTLAKEPTEAYPNGVPPTATLGFTAESVPAAFSRLPGAIDGRFFSAGELGMTLAMAERPNSDGLVIPTYTRFKSASMSRYSWQLRLGEGGAGGVLSDAWVEANTPEAGIDGLPAEFQKLMREAMERMRNMRVFGPDGPPPV
ncbi:MAG TPA: hypothetical protein PLL78_03185 [Fimbriimonadaceae bacterium]|nr:hypothetical protein [Fimbriimonadaceae bacterium]HRJ95664.1 hypothetical protein [Fimbriimonadaceae bacterium]